jgi:hypothetical protein
MSDNGFLHDALDAAAPVLNERPDGTYVVVACNDQDGTIQTGTVTRSKRSAAARQSRVVNNGFRGYMAVRFGDTDYLMGRFDGVDMIYLSRETRPAVAT